MKKFKLELYFFPECPYCQRVLEVINELKIAVTYYNTRKDQNALNKLRQDTGRQTVPCLYIDDKPMHESSDIIHWLRKNYQG
jgi:glutaredoxin 3